MEPINPAEIEHAVQLLRAGKLVAFPTETVYGLGANALDPEAVARIYAAKGRPASSPIIVHVCSIEMARSLVSAWPAVAEELAQKFWPGPLTLVLPTVPGQVPTIVTAGLASVGLRMPAHPLALALIRAANFPLAAPSANRFTQLSPTTADHVRRGLGTAVDFVIDGGPCRVGIESTVLSLTGAQPVLLRPGGITQTQLEAIAGPVITSTQAPLGPHPAPGMHPRHYSPRTPLFLTSDGTLPSEGCGVYLQHRHPPTQRGIVVQQMPQTAAEYAATLYGLLHDLDVAGYDWIAVDLPPHSSDWSAVLDRLQRAAGKE